MRSHQPEIPARLRTTDSPQEPLARVLVPTDFSRGARSAARRVAFLPLAHGAVVELLHVLGPDHPRGVRRELEADARTRLEGEAAAVRRTARRHGRSDLRLRCLLSSGQPFVEIIRRSRTMDAELIALGRRGRGTIRDMLLGSTARRVVQKGDVPVLLVAAEPGQDYSRPVLATGLDDASARTFALAQRILHPRIREVNVVHAFNVPFEGFVTPLPSAARKSAYRRSFQARAQKDLHTFLTTRIGQSIVWTPSVRAGEPRTVILGELLRHGADLLIVGTHARAGLAHALLGSVAEWAIASVPCDVLIARPVRFAFELP
jgi:nucleotide-binding universal stress UspA family protein